MTWDQALILVTGPAAIGLSQIEPTKRWACVIGLLGQAGWFHATWIAEQWGMFGASFVYAAMWLIGLFRHWILPWWSRSFGLAFATTFTAGPSTFRSPPEARAAASSSGGIDPAFDESPPSTGAVTSLG